MILIVIFNVAHKSRSLHCESEYAESANYIYVRIMTRRLKAGLQNIILGYNCLKLSCVMYDVLYLIPVFSIFKTID